MPAPPTLERFDTFADLRRELGDVPLNRILLQPLIGTATEKDLIDLLDGPNKRLCELVNGVLVEKTMGIRESAIAAKIAYYLGAYLEQKNIGLAFTADGPVRIRLGRIRMPDVCFVSWDRLPDEGLPDDPILDTNPELAVEVISKSNTRKEMTRKLRDYFSAGVLLVWYVYPKTETAVVYTSPSGGTTVAKDGHLDGGDILPGFKLPLKKIFLLQPPKKPKS